MRHVIGAALMAVMVLVVGPGAGAAPSSDDRVFTDPTNDGPPIGMAVTAPHQDLVAGYISEADTDISFTLEVADLPDAQVEHPDYGPLAPMLDCRNCFPYASYYWEFSLNPTLDGYVPACREGAVGECFTITAYVGTGQDPFGSFSWGCGPYEHAPFVTCNYTEVDVAVSVDVIADTVTVTVPRDAFRDYSRGGTELLATDGSVLVAEEFLGGIAAYTAPMGTTCDCLADAADMEPYTLGTNRR